MNSLIFFMIIIGNTFLLFSQSESVNCKDKKLIVNMHNNLRRKIANGQIRKQPKSSNMKFMIWDDKLASVAQQYANKMKLFQHNTKIKDSRFLVGENLFTVLIPIKQDIKGFDWSSIIESWFDEHLLYQFGSRFSTKTGHYTQIVWADTTLIGCGAKRFKKNKIYNAVIYVCNYGPGGNVHLRTPYKIGNGCENLCTDEPVKKVYGEYCH